MISQLRLAAIAPGKTGEAIAFANQIANYVKEKYGMAFEILMPIGWEPGPDCVARQLREHGTMGSPHS